MDGKGKCHIAKPLSDDPLLQSHGTAAVPGSKNIRNTKFAAILGSKAMATVGFPQSEAGKTHSGLKLGTSFPNFIPASDVWQRSGDLRDQLFAL